MSAAELANGTDTESKKASVCKKFLARYPRSI